MTPSAHKAQVLLLLFEPLLETVIYSQVLDHARELAEAGIADFEIWALPSDAQSYSHSEQQLERALRRAGCAIKLFRGVRPASPMSVRRNTRMLGAALAARGTKFSCIHARGEYAVLVGAQLARSRGIPLLWDCRGDAAAEVDYRADLRSLKGRVIAPALGHLLRKRMRDAARLCDVALFVSKPLHDLVKDDLAEKHYAVIPCCAEEKQFFFDEVLREEARASLGYAPQDLVLAYTGTLHAYQRFGDTVSAFARHRKKEPRARLLVVTPNRDAALPTLSQLPQNSWTLVSARFEEINRLLNAADAGFLLRDATPTNRVASPTKFAEYCLAGLPVIMNDAVPDSFRLAAEAGTVAPFDEASGEIGVIPAVDRADIAQRFRMTLSKKSYFPAYRAIYAAQADGIACAE